MAPLLTDAPPVFVCACGSNLPPELLSCPACHRLVHAEKLRQLVAEADSAEREGDVRTALAQLRSALDLLPQGSRQHAVILRRVQTLSDRIDSGAVPPSQSVKPSIDRHGASSPRSALLKGGSAAGVLGLLLWKFKFVLVFVATKAKILLLGLSKSTTLFSMLMSLGLYWTIWGWHFAAGLVLSIYVHEMGHVAALRHFGIRATAPMFIPGLGAVVRLNQYPQTAREDARVGLAGPVWGLGASVAALLAFWATGAPLLAAVGAVGAWINLFNLVPFWQLDGGRGFRSLSRPQRWIAVAVIAATWGVSQEGLLVLLLIAAVFQCFSKNAPESGDPRGLLTYTALVGSLALLSTVAVPT